MEYLEKEMGWREEDFDFILQSLRTILLKRTKPLRELNCIYEIGLLCTEQTEGLLYIPRRPHLTLFRHSSMRALGFSRCSTSRL